MLQEARKHGLADSAAVRNTQAMRAKLAENKELADRAATLEKRVKELEGTQTALRKVAGEHSDAAEESKLLEKEVTTLSWLLRLHSAAIITSNARRLLHILSPRCARFYVCRSSWKRVKKKSHGWKRGWAAESMIRRKPAWSILKVWFFGQESLRCLCTGWQWMMVESWIAMLRLGLPPSKHRTGPRSVESLEAELKKLRKENEFLRAANGSGGNGGASTSGAVSFAPFNSSPSVSSASMAQYPVTPGVRRGTAAASQTPFERRDSNGPVREFSNASFQASDALASRHLNALLFFILILREMWLCPCLLLQLTATKTECSGCASKNKSYESLVKKTRDVFQHYRAVVYELTGE